MYKDNSQQFVLILFNKKKLKKKEKVVDKSGSILYICRLFEHLFTLKNIRLWKT